MAKKHKSALKIPKKETHIKICVFLERNMLAVLSTIIPNYRRSQLIGELIMKYIGEHGTDKVDDK